LFDDQSRNVELLPYPVEFRLVTPPPAVPFANHMTDLLDFTLGEARFVGAGPPGVAGYADWTPIPFNH
jgi:diadenosine tetraphosphatase ApaH/serine/threonine PP2A family protein phosphatase